jgi:NAD-dependent deacetylase
LSSVATILFDESRSVLTGDLDRLGKAWATRRHAVALTGAGVSVESGIPDFRSECGLWHRFDPMEYGTLNCFLNDPAKAWELFRALGDSLRGKKPNPAHLALAGMEQRKEIGGILTQNIDGLHQAAGNRSVVELHGNHTALHCLGCGHTEPFEDRFLNPGPVPTCPACGHALKPNVVLFGEPVREPGAAHSLIAGCDTLFMIGTSAEVAPACLYPEAVLGSGGSILEFNLEVTNRTRSGLGRNGVLVKGPVGRTLPLFLEQVKA